MNGTGPHRRQRALSGQRRVDSSATDPTLRLGLRQPRPRRVARHPQSHAIPDRHTLSGHNRLIFAQSATLITHRPFPGVGQFSEIVNRADLELIRLRQRGAPAVDGGPPLPITSTEPDKLRR